MIHAMSMKKANKGRKEKEENCTDQVEKTANKFHPKFLS